MTSKLDTFGKDRAKSYDRNNRHLIPILSNLHYLIQIILTDLPANSRILCVGSGTGTEIIELSLAFPDFSFVAVEPSEAMINICKERLEQHQLLQRCKLIHGYIDDIHEIENFDAALSILVLHHTSKEERSKIIAKIATLLKPSGYFINAEISYDDSKDDFYDIIEKWKSLSRKAESVNETHLQNISKIMKDHLSVQTPSEIKTMLEASGFSKAIPFFQSLLIHAWYAIKK